MAQVIRERRQDAETYEYLASRKKKNFFVDFKIVGLIVCILGAMFSLYNGFWFTVYGTGFIVSLIFVIRDIVLNSKYQGARGEGHDFLDTYTNEMPEAYSHPEGDHGEDQVIEELDKLPENYYHANNVKMREAQIDHIVVCPKGVFTIETKNWQGDIFGNSGKDNWKEVFKYHYNNSWKEYSKSTPVKNPVVQAQRHSVKLSNYLKEKKFFNGFVQSLVVFIDNGNDVKVFSPHVPVLRPDGIVNYFSSLKDILNNEEVERIVSVIKENIV
jgi:hypothetical protein